MASKNLNFPKSYGTGIVLIPFQFTGSQTGGGTGLDIIRIMPPDDYSITIEAPGNGVVIVTTTDKFVELLTSTFQVGNGTSTEDFSYDGSPYAPGQQQSVSATCYAHAGGVRTPTYYFCTFSGLFVVRNSSAKF